MLKGFLGSRIYQNSNISPCAITYIKSQMIYGIYIKMVIYYQRFWAWFYTLNLFLSPLPSLTLFLFLQLHPQNHFTCGSDVEEIIHRTGCSIGNKIPYNLQKIFNLLIDCNRTNNPIYILKLLQYK